MQIKQSVFKIKGMRRDDSYSSFNPEYSWNNHNVRLTARDGNDLMSVTNERGNLKLNINLISIPKYQCTFTNYVGVFIYYNSTYRSLFTNYINTQRVINYSYNSDFTNYVEKFSPSTYIYNSDFTNYIESYRPISFSYNSIFNTYIEKLIFI